MYCPLFIPLTDDMRAHDIDKEHYAFVYNKYTFDVILSIVENGYEILVAIHTVNWGTVMHMSKHYNVEMDDKDYYSLCKILNLSWKEDHFNSSKFLILLSEKCPKHSSLTGVDYKELRKYIRYRLVEESEKIYFAGWNNHIKDGRKAKNFDKTEFYLGKRVADYCRKHNISSIWSALPRDETRISMPWS